MHALFFFPFILVYLLSGNIIFLKLAGIVLFVIFIPIFFELIPEIIGFFWAILTGLFGLFFPKKKK